MASNVGVQLWPPFKYYASSHATMYDSVVMSGISYFLSIAQKFLEVLSLISRSCFHDKEGGNFERIFISQYCHWPRYS